MIYSVWSPSQGQDESQAMNVKTELGSWGAVVLWANEMLFKPMRHFPDSISRVCVLDCATGEKSIWIIHGDVRSHTIVPMLPGSEP